MRILEPSPAVPDRSCPTRRLRSTLVVVLFAILTSPDLASAAAAILERSGAEGPDSLVLARVSDSLGIVPEDSLAVGEDADSLDAAVPVFRRRASLPT